MEITAGIKPTLENTGSESPKGHIKARTEKPDTYPERAPVSDGVSWETIDKSKYHPPYFVDNRVLANDRTKDPKNKKLWADPEDISLLEDKKFLSYEGEVRLDEKGRPLNPRGPTGIEGRGESIKVRGFRRNALLP